MGLDQYARSDNFKEPKFQWRKHAKLQEFMEAKWNEKLQEGFNCVDLPLSLEDINELETAITSNTLPESRGGMFFGRQYQDESSDEYKEQDLEFCEWAKNEIEQGRKVIYHCWW